MEINQIIKKQLLIHGTKQKKICEILGENKTRVSKKINGKTAFSIEEVKIIAKFFNMTVDELIGGSTNARTNA